MDCYRTIFLRHADTQKDPNVHAAQWSLSKLGVEQAVKAKEIAEMQEVEVIYVSEERKTALTVGPLAVQLGLTPIVDVRFNEVARGEKFLSKEQFEIEKNRQLEDLEYAAFNGESGNAALVRFKEGVQDAIDAHPGKTMLIVTHGTVLNLYFADLLGAFSELPARWSKTAFCAYGIIENGAVVKDIV